MVEDRVTHRFFLLFLLSLEKNPSVRPPIDFQSLLLIFLDNASCLRKKGGRKKKKRIQRRERKEIDSFVNHLFSRDKLNFFRVGGGGAGERVAQRACKSERGTTYFYPGRSTGRYGFFARCRRSRVSWRAFEARRGK